MLIKKLLTLKMYLIVDMCYKVLYIRYMYCGLMCLYIVDKFNGKNVGKSVEKWSIIINFVKIGLI